MDWFKIGQMKKTRNFCILRISNLEYKKYLNSFHNGLPINALLIISGEELNIQLNENMSLKIKNVFSLGDA